MVVAGCGGGVDETTSDSSPPVSLQSPVEFGEPIPESERRVISTTEARPFIPNAPYASVLAACAAAEYTDPCTLSTLPYIGQENPVPTVGDIMERVLVTHDWMGVRLEQMLKRLPADLLPMFAPITVVVIGSEVRPSSFSVAQGRVRLDPRTLWLSVDEKRTVATNDDPRTSYGSDLQFVSLYRFTSGNDYAWDFWSLTDNRERTSDDIELPLASLLYHELAHANDYIQPDKLASLSMDLTPWGAFELLDETRVSRQLYERGDLTGPFSYLYGLAGVRFFNDEATDFHKTVTADFAGADMGNEGKLIFYSYATSREDVAMLVEGAMMKHHYDVDVHVGFADKQADVRSCDLKVAWGERNRVASDLVAPRARYVADRILPHVNLSGLFSGGSGTASPLRVGDTWCDNLSSSAPAASRTISSTDEKDSVSRPHTHAPDPLLRHLDQ
jgi:hypothetical protein